MRVVLDTDVVVAGLRSRHGASRLWLRAVRRREVELLISVPLAIQYESVLLRPEIIASVRLTAQQIGQVLDLLCTIGRQVEISFLWRPMLRDPGDEMVLDTAMNGRADRLLTFNLRDYAGAERLGLRVERPGPAWQKRKDGLI